MSSKRILIIGGTGAQGAAVATALLTAKFTIRVLTRDPENPRAKSLFPPEYGVEMFKGSFMDIEAVRLALQDCYGVFVNTDSFTVKEADEIWAAIRIFEVSKRIPSLRHFVWSGLDYNLKLGNYDPAYGSYHVNAKGRVNDWLGAQPSSTGENELTWSILNTGPYMEMLHGGVFIPSVQPDGTRVYNLPLGSSRLPLISVADIGAFARVIFADRQAWSGKTLNGMSTFSTGTEIAETLSRVAGVKATYNPCTIEEWLALNPRSSQPVAVTDPNGPTWGQNWTMWWKGYEDELLVDQRDLGALRKLHPGLRTLESWMRETGYDGSPKPLLKQLIDLSAEGVTY